jgi:hypothetical protein
VTEIKIFFFHHSYKMLNLATLLSLVIATSALPVSVESAGAAALVLTSASVNGFVSNGARLAPFDTQSKQKASIRDLSLPAVVDDFQEGQEVKGAIAESFDKFADFISTRGDIVYSILRTITSEV